MNIGNSIGIGLSKRGLGTFPAPTYGIHLYGRSALPGEYTFTSTSGGQYYDENGALQTATANQPRFNYDQSTRAAKGLLITSAQTENASISNLANIGGMGSAMTVYAEIYCPTLGGAGFPSVFAFDDGTANNALAVSIRDAADDKISFDVLSGGVSQASIQPGSALTSGQLVKVGISWATNSFRCAVNGSAGTEDTSGTVPTVTRLLLGQGRGGGNYLNAELRIVLIWNGTQATNAQLAAMTL